MSREYDKIVNRIFHHIYLFINAWIEIICGVIKIITFTLYLPSWDFRFMGWFSQKMGQRRINQLQNETNKGR